MFSEMFKSKDSILRYIILIPIMIIPALLILTETKTAIGIIAVLILLFFCAGMISKIGSESTNKYILYFAVFTIPFPYLLQFLGKDALTLTTLMIYFVFAVIVLNYFVEKKNIIMQPKFAYILPILILISLTLSLLLNFYFIGQSFRYYVENVSGILLYFAVLITIKRRSEVILLIKIILFVLILQSGISFLQWRFPGVAGYFIPFGTRTFVPTASMVEGFTRATGTIWDYELLAQWFLIGGILSIALIYIEKRYIYSFCLFFCISGILFTKTRSDIILLVFAVMLIYAFLILFRKDYKNKLLKLAIIVIFIGMSITVIFPEQVGEFSERLETYFHSQRLISAESINRKEVWADALNFYLRRPTIFGRGLYRIQSFGYSGAKSFHSLYLTLLYKTGIFGLLVHAIFWLKMLHSSWLVLAKRGKYKKWYLVFFLFICLILMLVDGIKIEFLRYGHTIQFAWMLYALLIVALKQN